MRARRVVSNPPRRPAARSIPARGGLAPRSINWGKFLLVEGPYPLPRRALRTGRLVPWARSEFGTALLALVVVT
jgi:hypothetical protein